MKRQAPEGLITHCRLPLRFEPQRLLADLHAAEQQAWVGHHVGQNYRGDWSALPLRALDGREDNIQSPPQDAERFQDTAILLRCPYFQQVLAAFRCPLASVRLMRLGPGGEILEHFDPGCGYEYGDIRLHVPICTSPDVAFFLDGAQVPMQPGECWYLNFQLPHRVHNRGATARVHLVLDCVLNPWLDGMFQALGFGALERQGTRLRHLDSHIAGLRQAGTPQSRAALHELLALKAEVEAVQRERLHKTPP